MSQERKVLDGEVTIETAKIEVCLIGNGAAVTLRMVDEEDVTVVATSRLVRAFDMDDMDTYVEEMGRELNHQINQSLKEG